MSNNVTYPQWSKDGNWWWDGKKWRNINPSAPYPSNKTSTLNSRYSLLGCGLLVFAWGPIFLIMIATGNVSPNGFVTLSFFILFFGSIFLGGMLLRARHGASKHWTFPNSQKEKIFSEMENKIAAAQKNIPETRLVTTDIFSPTFKAASLLSRKAVIRQFREYHNMYPPIAIPSAIRNDASGTMLLGEINPFNFNMAGEVQDKNKIRPTAAYHCVAKLKGQYAIPETSIVAENKENSFYNKTLLGKKDRDSTSAQFNKMFMVNYKVVDHPIMEPHFIELLIENHSKGYRYMITGSLVIVSSSDEKTDLLHLWNHTTLLAKTIPPYLYT